MKKLVLIFLTICLMAATLTVASATGEDYAVYLKGDIYVHSATVMGDIYSSEGEVRFNGAGDNKIQGDIYHSSAVDIVFENQNSLPKINGNIVPLDETAFDAPLQETAAAPTIANNIASLTSGRNNPLTISEDTHIGELNLVAPLTVDVSSGDVVLVVDKLSGGNINLIGNGSLTLYIGEDLALTSGMSINKDGDSTKVNIAVFGNVSIGDGCTVNGNIYKFGSILLLNAGGKVNGNIISNAETINLSGRTTINGILYAPLADVEMGGSAEINGRLVANTLDISGRSLIDNKNNSGALTLYDAFFQSSEAPEDETPDDSVPSYHAPYSFTNHYAYIFGRSDVTMAPNEAMLRGEACAVLYRLLKQNNQLGGFVYHASDAPRFADLQARWDRSAVEYMAYKNIYTADQSQSIEASQAASRGEVFKLFAIALDYTEDTTLTNEQYAAILVDTGCVQGYEDGSLRLEQNITRAEFCKIYNIITGRDILPLRTADGADVTHADYSFTDMPNAWYYEILLKATSAYDSNGFVDFSLRGERNMLDDYAS